MDSNMNLCKTNKVYVDDHFSKDKEMFDFSNHSAKSKYQDDTNALVVREIKHGIGGVANEEFVALKSKIYSILVSNVSEQKVSIKISLLKKKPQ